jgi:diacylglycerol kinase (ATP)
VERLVRASCNSWNGLRSAFRTEAALRHELGMLAVSIPCAFMLTYDPWKRVLLIGVVLVVIIVELLNTAIEKLADYLTQEQDERIGKVKDIGSAGIGVGLVLVALTWGVALQEWVGG